MQLGELLVLSKLLTEEQLQAAFVKQEETRRSLGETLIELGYITEKALAEALEFQLGFPFIPLYDYEAEAEAVQMLPEDAARKYGAMPLRTDKGKLLVAMTEPYNFAVIEQIRLISGMEIQPFIALRSDIEQAQNKYYGMHSQLGQWTEEQAEESRETEGADASVSDSPMVKLVNQMILSAANLKASDIHIEPTDKNLVIRYRIDGQLRKEQELPKSMQAPMIARVKIIAKLNIAERRLPQDGNIQIRMDNRRLDIRVSTLPTVHGESVVLRLLDQSTGIKQLNELGFSEWNLRLFRRGIGRPNGIVLISGPTGSGKTSTLYSVLENMRNEAVKIITAEDPVEYRMNGISQVQVNTQIGMTFSSTLRTILRQDPDIVMVGEIRDPETAEIAVRASLTGHLVLSTIHTNNAVSTFSRLSDMGIERYLIASSLACVTAQRLVRTNCPNCMTETEATDEEKRLLAAHGLVSEGEADQLKLKKGQGCGSCGHTGYKGRTGIHEVVVMDNRLRSLMMETTSLTDIEQRLISEGFRTMLADGLSKVLEGKTTVREVLKAAYSD